MPDMTLDLVPRSERIKYRVQQALWRVDNVLHHPVVATVFVLVVAVGLKLAQVDVQYVAGAFLVIFARRLAEKRFYPIVNLPKPTATTAMDEKIRRVTGTAADPFSSLDR